eukprot:GGOE01036457.1.p1 GENE.GGOE01036457.1~~GGOE01036457.1.p1  ORF type:complete len:334 (-),score=67.33 GGOE01036457.1:465-1436(-)
MTGTTLVARRCLPSLLPRHYTILTRRYATPCSPLQGADITKIRPELAPLVREHAVIEASIQAFRRALQGMDRGDGQLRADDALMQDFARYLRFVEDFTRLHHQKEEEVLFKVLEEEGHLGLADTLQSLAHEHQVLSGLHAALKQCQDSQNTRGMQQVGLELCAVLQQHIAQENAVLLPFASDRLSKEAMQRLPEGFRRVELQHPCAELEAFAHGFVGKYAEADRPSTPTPASSATPDAPRRDGTEGRKHRCCGGCRGHGHGHGHGHGACHGHGHGHSHGHGHGGCHGHGDGHGHGHGEHTRCGDNDAAHHRKPARACGCGGHH